MLSAPQPLELLVPGFHFCRIGSQKYTTEFTGASAATEVAPKRLELAVILLRGMLMVTRSPPAGRVFLIYPTALALRTSWADAAMTEAASAPTIEIHSVFFMVLSLFFFLNLCKAKSRDLFHCQRRYGKGALGVNTYARDFLLL
ncbi:MAG TPA: hypothetical protein DCM68_04160 [Verrucomicrobia bacterium]|nr:hypothetical protein [Verrucomicrobiota bacterium]